MIKHLCILVGVLAWCSIAQNTSDDQLLAYVMRYCSSRGTVRVSPPARTGKAGPRGPTGAKGEPGIVDYVAINEKMERMLEEKIASVDSKLAGITSAQERLEQCCNDVTELQKGMHALRREISSLLEVLGWRKARNGLFYTFVNSRKTWNDADADCRSKGSILASSGIRNVTVRSEVSAFANNNMFWIGLTDRTQEGMWTWLDGVSASPDDPIWNEGEPNDAGGKEDCALLFNKSGVWMANDGSCSDSTFVYLCEKTF